MSAKAIREFDGKSLLFAHLSLPSRLLQVDVSSLASSSKGENPSSGVLLEAKFAKAEEKHGAWLTAPGSRLVVKPDQLIKRRGKHQLVLLDATWPAVKAWIAERAGQETVIGGIKGKLTCFVVEPFVEHQASDESYVCIRGKREGDEVLYCAQGGVDVGDVDAKARRSLIPIDSTKADSAVLANELGCNETLAAFIARLHAVFAGCHFTYLEINPLVVVCSGKGDGKSSFHILDLAAKLDQTAEFEAHAAWKLAGHHMAFPPPFGRDAYPEEAYIAELDGRTGASLKLTILNPNGRIWTMVAGGGASVAYTDAIVNCLGPEKADELANYGEYSGAPTETQTYDYARTIFDLLTRHATPVLLDTNTATATSTSGGGFASSSTEQAAQEGQQQSDKVLFIGGGIANFTNVATTFRGIIRALRHYAPLLRSSTRIYVRRGGPNWHEGLRAMREVGDELGLRMWVFGPETHITAIVPMALSAQNADGSSIGSSGTLPTPPIPSVDSASNLLEQLLLSNPAAGAGGHSSGSRSISPSPRKALSTKPKASIRDGDVMNGSVRLFSPTAASELPACAAGKPGKEGGGAPLLLTNTTRCFVWGMQSKAVQGMLDFDYISRRSVPSVAAMIYPFGGEHQQKFYWGTSEETLVPVYAGLGEAVERHPEVDVLVNFASCRSALETCAEALNILQPDRYCVTGTGRSKFRTIAVIAEGVPERHARQLGKLANQRGTVVIGPATVGGVRAGAFRIGNTGGMIDNLLGARLYRPGSVSYVSRSGGMSNELNNVVARVTDGVCEGIAIGGDRFPGSGFLPHVLRFEADPRCHVVVLLGEVGGAEEYAVADAIKQGLVTKPVVAWCIGVCAEVLATDGGVQFGHAGAMAEGCSETASAKMDALRQAGAIVPATFEDLPSVLRSVFDGLVEQGKIVIAPEPVLPTIPVDYAWAAELGLIRRPAASFVSTICDDRGQELLYAGVPISRVFEEDIGVGGVLGLLWFRRRLPTYACRFIEMVLMLTADHGPAVSGAHNCIVTARAGRDLPSALCSGLLTIGDRFGGASDGAAEQFSAAFDAGMLPEEFVKDMRRQHKLIMGIGHRVKSVANPDKRVTLLVDYARRHFPTTPLLDYACAVERVTTAKKDTLILNVDGAIGVLFVDLLRHSGAFTPAEAEEYVRIGTLSGLFVLGRSIGFIGHYLDQRRLKQGLYRHPWDDISYLMPTLNQSKP